MSVAIIDYGSGNLHSAAKAFERAARSLVASRRWALGGTERPPAWRASPKSDTCTRPDLPTSTLSGLKSR